MPQKTVVDNDAVTGHKHYRNRKLLALAYVLTD